MWLVNAATKLKPAWDFFITKRLYILIPLGALTIANYVKDYDIRRKDALIDSLQDVATNLISNQISSAGIVEQTELIFWTKELDNDEYKIVYISPAYNNLLSKDVTRFDLMGRTGKFLDQEFGKVYQANDAIAATLKEPKIFKEPYRKNGIGPILMGKFLKGRIWKIENKVVIYGVFVEKVK